MDQAFLISRKAQDTNCAALHLLTSRKCYATRFPCGVEKKTATEEMKATG